MNRQRPRFSVIILAYEVQEYLSECLDSIIGQTFHDYEVILLNPPSTDGTDDICIKYESEYEQIRRLVIENRGQLLNRVAGFEAANGQYLLCVDGDDRWMPELLSTVDAGLRKSVSDVVIFGHKRFSENGELKVVNHIFSDGAVFVGEDGKLPVYKKLIQGGPINEMWAKVISKETFLRITENFEDFSEIRIAEDWLYSFYVIMAAESVLYLDQALYEYRIRQGSTMRSFRQNELSDRLKVYTQIEKLMEDTNLDTPEYVMMFAKCMALGLSNWIYRCSVASIPYSKKKDLYQELKRSSIFEQIKPYLKSVNIKYRYKIFVCIYLYSYLILHGYSCLFCLLKKIFHKKKEWRKWK